MGHYSDGHLYMDNRSKKPLNVRYALIEHEGRKNIFDSIHGAEDYCMKHNLDPDKVIQSWTEEIKAQCRNLASDRLVALEEANEALRAGWEKQLAYSDKRAAIKEEHENREGRNWDEGLDKDYLTQAQGMVAGYHAAMQEFDKVKTVYLNILWFS